MTRSLARRIGTDCIAVLFMTCFAPVSTSAQDRLSHDDPSFSITIPQGFRRLTRNVMPGTLYGFGEPSDGQNPILNFSIRDLGRRITPVRLSLEDIKDSGWGVDFIEYEDLKGVELSVAGKEFEYAGMELFSLTVQIPLEERGIQLNVTGPVERKAEGRALFKQLLASFEGTLVSSASEQTVVVTYVRSKYAWIGALGVVALLGYGIVRLVVWRRVAASLRLRLVWLKITIVLLLLGAAFRVAGFFDDWPPRSLAAAGVSIYLLLALLALVIHHSLKRDGTRATPGRTIEAES